MFNIIRTVKKGDYLYAVVPNHPKRTINNYVLLHRVIMENYLGRLLTNDEVVHHRDGNKFNNKIENLEVTTAVEHAKIHGAEHLKSLVKLKCPVCEKIFVRAKNKTFLIKRSKLNCGCCSRSCSGKLSNFFQNNDLSPRLKQKIKENVVEEYKGKI